MLSPAHLLMNAIPVVGQIDWIVLLLISLRQALANCPPATRHNLFTRRLSIEPGQWERYIETLVTLTRQSADAAGGSVKTKVPTVASVRKNAVFAGRVVKGFTRRVARRSGIQPGRASRPS